MYLSLKRYSLLTVGCLLFSIYAAVLLQPNDIGTGGLLGISLILNKLFGFKIGLSTLLINIPLFILGFKLLGKNFAIKSGIIVILSSTLIDIIPTIFDVTPLKDKLTAAIFCGVVSGAAMSFIFMGGGSTGGLDISGKIIRKIFPNIPLSNILLCQDIFIYIIVGITLGLEYVMYALIMSFIRSKTIETVQKTFSASKQCMIICDDPKPIIKAISQKLGRGVTILDAVGGYSDHSKKFIYVVVQTNELSSLKSIVSSIDSKAFITISEVEHIHGNFKEHSLSV